MVNQNLTATEIGFTHEDFAALLDKYDYHFSPGDVVPGTVFSIEPRGALIDIGAKTAAYIPIQEMSINRVDAPEEVLQSNETREFFILTDENEDGQLTLSIRRIEYMRAWERVRQLQAEDATVRSGVFATNRGGALVRIEGLRGFIPGSHISTRKPKEELVGEDLPLKFLEVDEERNRLVLSHRRALVERKMNRLEVGEVVTQVTGLLTQMAQAIAAAASIAILAGIAVLVGAIAASRAGRIYDSVILKLLGSTRSQILAAQAIEYAFLALLLGLLSLGLGMAAGWYVIVQIFDFKFAPDYAVLAVTLLGGAGITFLLGLAGSLPILAARPAQALRSL
ncbi:MAG: S1 RNA-binding domain-containing protein [Pseudanabaena sp. CRU_2_10]|nr:S1 RNA-binding domain-containing protein [Pseudanabaena sp. CRU_2_10]